jgi:proteic killer suppression protein
MVFKSFKHKGLQTFFETGSKKGIIPNHAGKLARILDRLDASVTPADMNLPGYRLHQLAGEEKGVWSVWVNGNWRVTFRFEQENAILVDYRDYH